MIHTQQVHPLTDFLRNSKAFTDRIDLEKKPVGLTVNGKVKLVIMDTDTFEELSAIQERQRFIAAIRESEQAIREGQFTSLEEFDKEFRAKFDLPS